MLWTMSPSAGLQSNDSVLRLQVAEIMQEQQMAQMAAMQGQQ